MAYDIGPKIGIDGEAEFRKSLKSISEQARTLKSEVKAVTAEFDKNDKSQAAVSKQTDALNRYIKQQEALIEEQKKGLEAARKTLGDTADETQQWARVVNESQAELNKLNRRLKELESETEEVETETVEMAKSMDKAGGEAKDLGSVFKDNLLANLATEGLKMMADAIRDVASAAKDAVVDAALYADEIATLSVQTGLAVETLQEYQYMAELMDTSVDTITGSMAKLTKNMSTAQKGTGDAYNAFKELGVSIEDADGTLRNNQDVFYELIDALGQMEDETQRDAYAMAIFGKSAQDLNPMIATGAEGMAAFADEAHKMGYVLDGESIEALVGVSNAMERLKNMGDAVSRQIAVKLAPTILDAVDAFAAWAEGVDWDEVAETVEDTAKQVIDFFGEVASHKDEILAVISGIGAAFLTWNVGNMIVGIVTAVQAMSAAFAAASGGAAGLSAAFAAVGLANPFVLIATAIAGVVTAVIVAWNTSEEFRTAVIACWENIKQAVSDFVSAFMTDIETFAADMAAVSDAIVGAFTSAVDWLEGIFAAGAEFISGLASEAAQWGQNIIDQIVAGLAQAAAIKTAVEDAFAGAIEYITSLPGKAVEWGKDFINGMREGIENAVGGLLNSVQDIAGDISSFLHFSRPDRGPLRNYETWMPDFMEGLARSLDNSSYLLEDAVNRVASRTGAQMQLSPASGPTTNLGGVSINVQAAPGQDTNAIANAVMQKMQHLYDSKRSVYR